MLLQKRIRASAANYERAAEAREREVADLRKVSDGRRKRVRELEVELQRQKTIAKVPLPPRVFFIGAGVCDLVMNLRMPPNLDMWAALPKIFSKVTGRCDLIRTAVNFL